MSVEVKILFFAKAREIVGKQVVTLEVPEKVSYDNLLDLITKIFALEKIRNNLILAHNEEYCTSGKEIVLKSGDEVAVIPPLSGDEVTEKVTASDCGAISLFVGTTRDNFEKKKVLTLEYEAYEPMAEKAMKQICAEIRDKWKHVKNIAIYHRLGNVAVTESSVIIGISSPHRNDAILATQWCIENLKKSVPIWKKEVYEKTEPKWKENTECPWSNNVNKTVTFKPEFDIPYVSPHLIQINCSNEEIERRIDTFMQRKREQANVTNIIDFCGQRNTEDTCARIDAVLRRQKNSKSHLRMQRVYNTYGPYNVNKNQTYVSKAIEERIDSLENSLNVEKPVAPDIYERLKKIEDRILLLESISPEYSHFWNKEFMVLQKEKQEPSSSVNVCKKTRYQMNDVDNLLYELEKEAQLNI